MKSNSLLTYPFKTQKGGRSIRFTTARDTIYEATFTPASGYFSSYGFALDVVEFSFYDLDESAMPSGFDARIGRTIIDIITEYFRQNPQAVVCYVCDQADARAFKRAIRFARLFEQGNTGQRLEKVDVEQPPLFASVLFHQGHPLRAEEIKRESKIWRKSFWTNESIVIQAASS